MPYKRYNVNVYLPRRTLLGLAACLCIVLLPLGGGALGATSPGANGDIVFVRGGSIFRLANNSVTSVATGVTPSWSPNGTKLALSTGSPGTIETCTASSCTPAAVSGAAAGSNPVWSPDGTKLAYDSGGSIHVIPSAGGTDTTLVVGSDPTWSPDGTKLAFVRGGGSIATCTVSSCSANTIVAGTQPAWSPDGLSIAYYTGSDVDVLPASGGTAALVAAGASSPAWSPDSDSIALVLTSTLQVAVTQGSGTSWGAASARTQGTTLGGPGDLTPDWQTVAPIAGTAPSIFGTAQTGNLLSASNGTWSGASATGYTFQWLRCDSAGNNCVNIGSPSSSSSYAVVNADVGSRLRVVSIASNAAGQTSSAQSNATSVVTQAGVVNPPVNTAPPEVDLPLDNTVPRVGDFVSAFQGSWSGSFPMTFTYQWVMCPADDPLNGPCFSIPGATSSFFTVPASLYGFRFRIVVTATNSAASAHQSSAATEIVTAIKPRLTGTPPIVGQPTVEQSLSVGPGVWEGSTPLTYAYEWRRCDPVGTLASCTPIAKATTSDYSPQVADIGFSLRVYITASNPAGSVLGITNHTYPVVDKQHFSPSSIDVPTITGTAGVARQLTASIGSFSGDAPVATSFVWQRCNAIGTACRTIVGATKIVYNPTAFDIGSTIRLAVTAKNAYGTITSTSDASEPVAAGPPHRRGRYIVGTAHADYLAGGGYDDTIFGLGGNDTILGGAGDDHIYGGAGNDVITGGPGADTIFGGAGSDTIYAADGERDVIDCGAGADRAVVDSVDIVKNCEVVQVVSAAGTGSGSGSGSGSGAGPGGTTSP